MSNANIRLIENLLLSNNQQHFKVDFDAGSFLYLKMKYENLLVKIKSNLDDAAQIDIDRIELQAISTQLVPMLQADGLKYAAAYFQYKVLAALEPANKLYKQQLTLASNELAENLAEASFYVADKENFFNQFKIKCNASASKSASELFKELDTQLTEQENNSLKSSISSATKNYSKLYSQYRENCYKQNLKNAILAGFEFSSLVSVQGLYAEVANYFNCKAIGIFPVDKDVYKIRLEQARERLVQSLYTATASMSIEDKSRFFANFKKECLKKISATKSVFSETNFNFSVTEKQEIETELVGVGLDFTQLEQDVLKYLIDKEFDNLDGQLANEADKLKALELIDANMVKLKALNNIHLQGHLSAKPGKGYADFIDKHKEHKDFIDKYIERVSLEKKLPAKMKEMQATVETGDPAKAMAKAVEIGELIAKVYANNVNLENVLPKVRSLIEVQGNQFDYSEKAYKYAGMLSEVSTDNFMKFTSDADDAGRVPSQDRGCILSQQAKLSSHILLNLTAPATRQTIYQAEENKSEEDISYESAAKQSLLALIKPAPKPGFMDKLREIGAVISNGFKWIGMKLGLVRANRASVVGGGSTAAVLDQTGGAAKITGIAAHDEEPLSGAQIINGSGVQGLPSKSIPIERDIKTDLHTDSSTDMSDRTNGISFDDDTCTVGTSYNGSWYDADKSDRDDIDKDNRTPGLN